MWYRTNISHPHRLALGISCNEYCIIDLIAHKQCYERQQKGVRVDHEGQQYCDVADTRISKCLGIERNTVIRIQNKLIKLGFLECITLSARKKIKRATGKYFSVMNLPLQLLQGGEKAAAPDKELQALKEQLQALKAENDALKLQVECAKTNTKKEISVQKRALNKEQEKPLVLQKVALSVTKSSTNSKVVSSSNISNKLDISETADKGEHKKEEKKTSKPPKTYWVIEAWHEMYEQLFGARLKQNEISKKEKGNFKRLMQILSDKLPKSHTDEELYQLAQKFFLQIRTLYASKEVGILKKPEQLLPSQLVMNRSNIAIKLRQQFGGTKAAPIKNKFDNFNNNNPNNGYEIFE